MFQVLKQQGDLNHINYEFFLFLFRLYNLQNYKNMKTLNYGQKVRGVLLGLDKQSKIAV
jgi:hypothetical protein